MDYKTVRGETEYSYDIQRSLFIGKSYNIVSEEQAREMIAALNKRYYDSTHICYAYVLQSGEKKFCDDGEPQGTAGKPILEAIEKKGFKNTLVAVVRYFGGIKLGAGGLTRAYCQSAASVLENSHVVTLESVKIYSLEFDFATYKKISTKLKNPDIIELGVEYSDCVIATVGLRRDMTEDIINLASGKVKIEFLEEKFIEL